MLDVARRIAGTGSLGLDRYVILVEGKGSPDGNYLLDLKQALPSTLVPHLKLEQPTWPSEAHRVVSLQRRLQAVSIAFLHPVMLDDNPFTLRAMQPAEDRVALAEARHTAAELSPARDRPGSDHGVGPAQKLGARRVGGRGRSHRVRAPSQVEGPPADASIDCAAGVTKDAVAFNAAWDDGQFGR